MSIIYLAGSISNGNKLDQEAREKNIQRFINKGNELRELGREVHIPCEGEPKNQLYEY